MTETTQNCANFVNALLVLHFLILFFAHLSYLYTVLLIEMPHFYVGKLPLHHYRSDLAHISDLYSLVIGLSKSER